MKWRQDSDDDASAVHDRDDDEASRVRLASDERSDQDPHADTGTETNSGTDMDADRTDADRIDSADEDEQVQRERLEDERIQDERIQAGDGVSPAYEAGAATPMAPPPRTAADIAGEPEPDQADTEAETEAEAGGDRERAAQSLPGETDTAAGAVPGQESAVRTAQPASDEAEDLIPAAEAERLHGRWRDLQASFVDDPHAAVEGADELVGAAMAMMTERFEAQRGTLAGSWRDTESDDTEALRVALRRYRRIFDSLIPS